MKSKENGIVKSMGKTIINNFLDPISDASETALDEILNYVNYNPILKDVPVFNTIISVCKTGMNIRERHFLKETAAFITGLNKSTISEKKKEKYKKSYETNPRFAEKALEKVVILLNSHNETEKSRRLGKIFGSFIEEKINWEQFSELSDANSRLFENDYETLNKVYLGEACREYYQLMRLAAIGLVMDNGPIAKDGQLTINEKNYTCTPLGKTFIEVCTSFKG